MRSPPRGTFLLSVGRDATIGTGYSSHESIRDIFLDMRRAGASRNPLGPVAGDPALHEEASRPTTQLACVTPPRERLLGDWHGTLLIWKPSWLVLLVNDATRLPVLLPARELSGLHQRIPGAVVDVLIALGIDALAVTREQRAMENLSPERQTTAASWVR